MIGNSDFNKDVIRNNNFDKKNYKLILSSILNTNPK